MGANANTIDLRLVVKDDGSVTIANFAGGVEHQAPAWPGRGQARTSANPVT